MVKPTRKKTALHLLVVSDDAASTASQPHLAHLLGHKTAVQSGPAKALTAALTGEFDAMLLDLGMPRIDGFELLKRLRQEEMAAERTPLPVIAMTGHVSEFDRPRCLAAGFNEWVAKPIHAIALDAALDRVLAGPLRAPGPSPTDADRLRATTRDLSDTLPAGRVFAPTVTESLALRSTQLIEALRSARSRRDLEHTVRSARALRTSAEFLGALGLAQMCVDYEDVAQQQRWEALTDRLQTIEHEHQAVLTLLFESAR